VRFIFDGNGEEGTTAIPTSAEMANSTELTSGIQRAQNVHPKTTPLQMHVQRSSWGLLEPTTRLPERLQKY